MDGATVGCAVATLAVLALLHGALPVAATTGTQSLDRSDATSVTYERGTSLEGFEATFAESDGGLTDTDLPGFGLLVAAVAILVVALRLR